MPVELCQLADYLEVPVAIRLALPPGGPSGRIGRAVDCDQASPRAADPHRLLLGRGPAGVSTWTADLAVRADYGKKGRS